MSLWLSWERSSKNAEVNWTTVTFEKAAFAIYQAFKKNLTTYFMTMLRPRLYGPQKFTLCLCPPCFGTWVATSHCWQGTAVGL